MRNSQSCCEDGEWRDRFAAPGEIGRERRATMGCPRGRCGRPALEPLGGNEESRLGNQAPSAQAAYPRRHPSNPDADDSEMLARLSVMVSKPTKRQLERLAASYGVTQREMLERALAGAERQVLEALPSKAQEDDFEWGSV